MFFKEENFSLNDKPEPSKLQPTANIPWLEESLPSLTAFQAAVVCHYNSCLYKPKQAQFPQSPFKAGCLRSSASWPNLYWPLSWISAPFLKGKAKSQAEYFRWDSTSTDQRRNSSNTAQSANNLMYLSRQFALLMMTGCCWFLHNFMSTTAPQILYRRAANQPASFQPLLVQNNKKKQTTKMELKHLYTEKSIYWYQ